MKVDLYIAILDFSFGVFSFIATFFAFGKFMDGKIKGIPFFGFIAIFLLWIIINVLIMPHI